MARVYDFWLGGKDHYGVDRQLAWEIGALAPEVPRAARANRAFLVQVVRDLAGQGLDQYLDLGCGLPTRPSVHEIARKIVPSAWTVYVDRDETVAVHGRALLGGDPGVVLVQADLRDPAAVLDDPRVREVLNLRRPVVVLMLAVLHFVGDDQDPARLVKAYVDRLAPGSVVVVSHATTLADLAPWTRPGPGPEPGASGVPRVSGASAALLRHTHHEGEGPPGTLADAPGPDTCEPAPAGGLEVEDRVRDAAVLYSRHAVPITLRSIREVKALMGGLVLDPPGVVPAHAWSSDMTAALEGEDDATVLVTVGRIPR